ncbi:unnamed protein product, partial [Heterotrigona itama]
MWTDGTSGKPMPGFSDVPAGKAITPQNKQDGRTTTARREDYGRSRINRISVGLQYIGGGFRGLARTPAKLLLDTGS